MCCETFTLNSNRSCHLTATRRNMDATGSAYLQEAAMTEKMPLIISVKRRLPEKVNDRDGV